MGRLRFAEGGFAASEDSETGNASLETGSESCLAKKLESWRHDPDLCLIWAAFCTTSPLTLADGLQLAKTRRSANEALQLLAGTGVELPETNSPSTSSRRVPEEAGDETFSRREPFQFEVPTDLKASEGQSSGASRPAREESSDVPSPVHKAPGEQPSTSSTAPAFADSSDLLRPCIEVFEPWSVAGFTMVARLAKSMHGEVHYLQDKDGCGAVAKVMPKDAVKLTGNPPILALPQEHNERLVWFSDTEVLSVEDMKSEIAALHFLQRTFEQSDHIIRLRGTFQDETSIYLVTEYCDEGDLFERVAYGEPLAEIEKKRYVSELLQAVQHLHRHNLGHRDVSLENVLLRRGKCVLTDFGQAVRLRRADGTSIRYYAEAGKKMYRSPEMHVPRSDAIQVVCPAESSPGAVAQVSYERTRCEVLLPADAVPGKPCTAEPYGYAAAPADVFACGVCAFVLAVGKPPWTAAMDTDPSFSFIRRHGVTNLLQQWRGGARGPPSSPTEEESLLAEMLRVDPTKRSAVDECLWSQWLDAVEPPRTRSQSA
mmetsp:Transcript_77169/g.136189  ORF Transcript_77169/g.136189 Transcript_77169/m.136189 type:complete len:542 (-) Transcript_77169:94-1719(-)